MKHSLFASTVLALSLLGAGCSPSPSPVAVQPTPIPIPAPTPAPAVPTYPEDPSPVRPRPTHEICDTKNFICVSEALINKTFTGSISATGTAIAFENHFSWELVNTSGTVLFSGSLTANAPDIGQPGPFTLSAVTPVATPLAATLRFYEASAQNGTPTHILNVPVTIN